MEPSLVTLNDVEGVLNRNLFWLKFDMNIKYYDLIYVIVELDPVEIKMHCGISNKM
jgi:hypothetical protein